MLKAVLSVCHTRGPHLNVQDIKTHFAPYDTAMFLVYWHTKIHVKEY